MSTLQQQAEEYLGTSIEPSEWDEAKAYAERKLQNIISRFGDEAGARREPWYLAQLIAESVRSSRLMKFTIGLMEPEEHDNEMGIKKEQPVSC